MAVIPEKVRRSELSWEIEEAGLPLLKQGKSKDIFGLPDFGDGYLLMLFSDRISIFNFVLPALVEGKGRIMAEMTLKLFTILKGYPNHLVAWGEEIDNFLPDELWYNPELQSSAIVVFKHELIPVECIVRGYLTGSAWRQYKDNNGLVYGHQMESGLYNGYKLPEPIFTPTEKSETDDPLNVDKVVEEYGAWIEGKPIAIYNKLAKFAKEKEIIIADIKLEFDKEGVLIDAITQEECRLWRNSEYEDAIAKGTAPPNYDKEYVRKWGMSVETPFGVGLNNLNPLEPEHVDFIHNQLEVPEKILSGTYERHEFIFNEMFSRL